MPENTLTPWPGGPTIKPSASTERTKSGPPPPGCIIKDLWVDDDHDDHHDQIYKCLNFFVSQPIFFIFGHMIGIATARAVMEPDFRIFDVGWQWEGSEIRFSRL